MTAGALPNSDSRPPASDLRLGVIICDCGREIAGRLDTEALRAQTAALPGVVFAAREAYPCSKDGQARLRQSVADQKLERVLIAGCAPRLVEALFRQALGHDGGQVEVADIREGCAFVHTGEAAREKAADLIAMGVARLSAASGPRPHTGRVVKAALVIGSGLSGLAAALSLADEGIRVILVERRDALGGPQPAIDERAREMTRERIESVTHHPRIQRLLSARIADVSGRPGDYEVRVAHGDQTTPFAVGAILVAADSFPKPLESGRWFDRARVATQVEFEKELEAASGQVGNLPHNDIVMILCAEEAGAARCSRLCCLAGIRQAIRVKQASPEANVTVLFRDLYLGGAGDLHADELLQARELGVSFFRYPKDHPPVVGDRTVDVPDPLTGEPLRLPFDRVVLATPLEPPDEASALAALLRLPQDENGFLVEPRVRLRPGRYTDDGVYVLGGAHQPVDADEALFQAYVTSARALRFLNQESIRIEAAVAEVDAALCTGCASCAPACPTAAITLAPRAQAEVLSLATVEALRCTGCGNCVVACPVKAITLPGWDDAALLAQISAALRPRQGAPPLPRVIAFACEWSAYAAADMAGARRAPYPAEARLIRLPCSARFDPYHILWAFLNGAQGVLLGACPKGECHYGAGNRYAAERVEELKKQLADHGIDPRRLRLEFLRGDDGQRFARTITEFAEAVGSHQSSVSSRQS